MLGLVAVSVGAVLIAAVWRIARGWDGWEPARVLLVVGAVLMPPALAVWMVTGPLRGGWAVRAGTPPNLLAAAAATASAPSVAAIVLPEQAAFSGSANLDRASTGEAATLSTSVQTSDPTSLSLSILLDGDQEEEGFAVRSGTIRLIPPQGAATYRGEIDRPGRRHAPGATLGRLRGRDRIAVQMSISASGQVQGQLLIGAVSSREVAQ